MYSRTLFHHRKKETLPFAASWMDLEGFLFNEIKQEQKHKDCIFPSQREAKKWIPKKWRVEVTEPGKGVEERREDG